MRYDKEHKERTRQRLLTEAAAAIRAEGPDQIGVSALMSRLGLTHGGFYAHFKSKDDLVQQAIDKSFEQSRGQLVEAIEGQSPSEGLIGYIDAYLSTAHVAHPESGCPLPALSADISRMAGPARARHAQGASGVERLFAAALEKMGIPPAEAPAMATSALAEMVGAVLLARAATGPDEIARIIDSSRKSVKARLGLA